MNLIGASVTFTPHRPDEHDVIAEVHVPTSLKGYVNLDLTVRVWWYFHKVYKYSIQLT